MKARRLVYIAVTGAICLALAAGAFWLGGTWRLPFFWAVLGLQGLLGIVGSLVLDDSLVRERINPQGKDKDPLGRFFLTLLWLAHFGIAAVDVGRIHISDSVPELLQVISFLPLALGWAGLLWSMKINQFFSSAIRLQPDRGQKVIMEGPYRWIRHPGYAFASLAFLSEGVALGSWLSVVPGILIVLHLIYRTVLEERLLINDLPGYKDYTQQVCFRWLPGVW